MDTKFLEHYYEHVILQQYSKAVDFKAITWKDHGKVGLDTWAHYFEDEHGKEYALLYEYFPGGEYLNDGLTHIIVKCGQEDSVQVSLSNGKQLENVVGYFTLYQER